MNPLYTVIAAVLIYLVATAYLGITGGLMALLFVVGALALFNFAAKKKLFLPINRRSSMWAAMIFLGIPMFYAGWFNAVGLSPAAFGGGGGGTGGVSPVTLTECQSGISSEILGKQATVTINAYDMESNTPYSAAVDTVFYLTDQNGNINKQADSTANGLTVYSVGDVLSVKGGNTTYYVDEETFCINKEAFPLNLKARAVTDISGLEITCKEDQAACSAGTNSSQEDYDITLGANEDKEFALKTKVNVSVKSFNFKGYVVRVTNDIDDCYPTSGYTRESISKTLKSTPIAGDPSDNNFTGGYDYAYVLATPVLLHNWDYVEDDWVIEGGATDPANSETTTSGDTCIVCAVDAVWDRGSDNGLHLDYYTHDTTEGNVGMLEYWWEPYGKNGCTIIEGI